MKRLRDLDLGLGPTRHDPPAGRPRLDARRPVTVVGGGLAGVAAAVVLAERGAAVTLVEREPFLGGRVGAWSDALADGTPFEMERGFHAFFRQYYNLRALMRRVDPVLASLTPLHDYPLFGPDGQRESFSDLPRTTPWNLVSLVWRTPTLKLRDLVRVDRDQAFEMLRYDPDRTFAEHDHRSADAWLDDLNFPARARQMLFDVFAHSFFNPPEAMSAAEMIRMFHFYFLGNPEGLVFDVLNRPFSTALWAPLEAWLERRGARVLKGASAERVARHGEGWRVELAGDAGPVDGDAVVLAVTVPALKGLVAASPDLGDAAWRRAVDGLDVTLPFAVWRLWTDRPAAPDRQPFVGTAGLGLLDNISLYERLEDESAAWAARTGGSVVELHAYAVPEDLSEEAIKADLLARLHALYPELRGARVLEERWLLRRDCPGFPMGAWRTRPGTATPADGVALAGDFVKLPFPGALMEGATASGFLAANHLLARWGVSGEPLWSVPERGPLAALEAALPAWLPGRRAAAP